MQFERSGVEFGTNNKMLRNLFKELYRNVFTIENDSFSQKHLNIPM